jgi:hypothetical protein
MRRKPFIHRLDREHLLETDWAIFNVPCENPCEKVFPKFAKTGQNWKECEKRDICYIQYLYKYEEVVKLKGLAYESEGPWFESKWAYQ